MSLLSKFSILLGLILILFGANLIYQRYSPKNLEFNNIPVTNKSLSKILPVRITIQSVKIDNGVYPSKIVNKQWETTDKGVSYLASSPVPGVMGNSILYGHNWHSILGNLTKVKPGQKIKITYNSGETKTFVVKFTLVVDPNEEQVLDATKDQRITIYTCTGFLDSKRFVAIATLSK
jgi:LPXTG-site transpeptidase (sortase) family protein